MFRLPPLTLWTPLSPQRTRGCSPLVTPKRKSSGKNRAVCPAAQTLFRFFPSSDLECCARVWQGREVFGFSFRRLAPAANPLSRLRRQLSRRESPWQNQQVSSTPVNGRRNQPISGKLYAPAKASPFRERWHGEAVTERVDSRTNPLSLAALDSSPEGRALGKEGKSHPYRSTTRRI